VRIQRTITILLPDDPDLRATLDAFQQVQQAVSPVCFHDGKPLGALALQRAVYHAVKGSVSAQMTCSAIRLVAAAYASARSNKRPAQHPFTFHRKCTLFLVGARGRDADFREDGTLSIWTVAGRKRTSYTVPPAFRDTLGGAVEIDALHVIERSGRLIGRVTLTLEVADPEGVLPVGVDRNETNAIVAVDQGGEEFFVSGREVRVRNKRNRKTRRRLQKKLAARKAEKKDTRSVRRLLKRFGRKQRNRTRTFAQTAAKQLVNWAPANAVLVFEDLNVPQPRKGAIRGRALRRRLSQWQRLLIEQAARDKAQERGILVATVNPAYTSQRCSRCGRPGVRKRHRFRCPHCGLEMHADVNAAINIRNRYAVLRHGGPVPELRDACHPVPKPCRSSGEGKPRRFDGCGR
jgi:IS605 OrfB family transposase